MKKNCYSLSLKISDNTVNDNPCILCVHETENYTSCDKNFTTENFLPFETNQGTCLNKTYSSSRPVIFIRLIRIFFQLILKENVL